MEDPRLELGLVSSGGSSSFKSNTQVACVLTPVIPQSFLKIYVHQILLFINYTKIYILFY